MRRARARAPDAAAVGPADARQRRQLPALHAVPPRGRGRDAGAAARGHPAARHAASAPSCASAPSPRTTRRPARSSIRTHEGDTEVQRYDQLILALGSVSRLLPVPGLEHAIGFKSLADAIWLRNHVIETLEARQRDRGPGRARGAAHLRLRRRRLRGPGGAGRAAGLRRRRDGLLPSGTARRDALDPGRGRRPGPPGDRPEAGGVRGTGAPGPGHRHPARHAPGVGGARLRSSSPRASASRPGRWSGPPG